MDTAADVVWARAWVGEPEPDWNRTDKPVGFGFVVTPDEVRSGEWLAVFRRAVVACRDAQYDPGERVDTFNTPNPQLEHDPPHWYVVNHGSPLVLQCHHRYYAVVHASRFRWSLLRSVNPTKKDAAASVDVTALRWYDVDGRRGDGWCRRCVVWRFQSDPGAVQTIGPEDHRYVGSYRGNQTTPRSPSQRHEHHHVWYNQTKIESVQAIHRGDPDWRPDAPTLTDDLFTTLKRVVGGSGKPVIEDPELLDRMFSTHIDLHAWNEVEDRNPDEVEQPPTRRFTTYHDIVQTWVLAEAARWVG